MPLKPWTEYGRRCLGCGAFLEPRVINGKRESFKSFQRRTCCNSVCYKNAPKHQPDLSCTPSVEYMIDPWLDQQLRRE